jgi:dTDP-4-amino-4,6-dideoxygalactose transaminase
VVKVEVKYIPSFRYYFPKDTIEWITSKINDLLKNGDFLTQGKYVEEFEKEFAKYIGTKYAVAVSSGTAALEIILRAIDIQGYHVIVPTNTFAATAYAVIHAGGKPIFADISADMNISISDIKKRLTKKTKVIIPVHIGGIISQNIYSLLELANKQNIYIVEDAAHAHGSTLNGKKAGTFGEANAFSFFSTKVITTGEGGMITSNNKEIVEKAKLLRDQGKIKGNIVGMIGYNWRMTELQAIIGLAQLRLLEEIIEKRNQIANFYYELLTEIPILYPFKPSKNARYNYYKLIVFLQKGRNPEKLRIHLKERYNVSLGGYVYEIPLHRQIVFKDYVEDINSYPIADDLCIRHITLPIYPQMTKDEVMYVIKSLKNSLRELGWI